MIKILDRAIDTQEVINNVAADAAGAVNTFIGTVRNNTANKNVQRLEFESFDAMAIKEIQKIITTASEKWGVCKASVYHRKGVLAIGEIAVVIAVSTPHRKNGFKACEYIIDTLKETVPIWKKEVFDDGEVWVAAHP